MAVYLLALLFAQLDPAPRTVGKVTDPALRELSGLVRSAHDPEHFWAHGDSGNPSALFLINSQGEVARRVDVAAPNLDWEDIATDRHGRLYVGDVGNNAGILPVRFIYVLDEPRAATDSPAKLEPRSVYCVGFPKKPFDIESLFVMDDRLLAVRKQRNGREATLHAIRLDRHGTPKAPVRWEPAGVLPGFTEPATGADLSPDGRRLAVCGNEVTRVYERQDPADWRLLATLRYPRRPIEAVAWHGTDLLLADESGWIGIWKEPVPTPVDATTRDARG